MSAVRTPPLRKLTAGLSLLSPAERRRGTLLVCFIVVGSGFDIYAIASLVPLFGLLTAPDVWSSKPIVRSVLEYAGTLDLHDLIPIITAIVAAQLIIVSAINVILRHLSNKFGMECAARLAEDLASSATHAPLIWFLQRNPTAVARQINQDTMRWGSNFIGKLSSVAQTATLTGLAVLAIIILAPLAGTIAIIIVTTFAALFRIATHKRLHRYAKAELKKTDSAMVTITQLISGIKDIKLSCNPQFFVDKFHSDFFSIGTINVRRGTIQQVIPVVLLMSGQVALIIVVFFMWYLGEPASRITEQALFLGLVASRLVPAINRIFADLAYIWDSFAYVNNLVSIRDTLKKNSSVTQRSLYQNSTGNEILFEQVGYTYPKAAKPALAKVSCHIQAGRSYGITGSSGAGKTTFLDLLLGLLTPTQGSVLIDKQLLSQIRLESWHSKIGYVSQQPYIIDDTLRANVVFGANPKEIDDSEVMKCLYESGLRGIETQLAKGLDTVLGDRGVCLSGGQRQRLAIARALYKKPSIIILDEATSSLDMISETDVLNTVRALQGKVTLLIVAHRLATIQWCDEVLFFSDGALVDYGPFDHVEKNNAEFSEMVRLSSMERPSSVPA